MYKYLSIIIVFLFYINGFSQVQEGIINIDSSSEIEKLVTKKIIYNKTIHNTNSTYTIQLFYGSENGAIRTQNKFRELFPNTTSSLEFDSPNWKVKVGHYKSRLIADKHLQEIILTFGDAIVLEPKKK